MILNNYYKYVGAFAVRSDTSKTAQKLQLRDFLGNISTNTLTIGIGTMSFTSSTSNRDASLVRVSTSWSAGQPGIALGSGTTPPTIDDYYLENPLIDQGASYTATATVGGANNNNLFSTTSLITVKNTGASAITIGELGLWTTDTTSGTSKTNRFLLERTVLDTPVVIEPDGMGVIEYTISFTPPTQQGA